MPNYTNTSFVDSLRRNLQAARDYYRPMVEEKNAALASMYAAMPKARQEAQARLWDPMAVESAAAGVRQGYQNTAQNLSDILNIARGRDEDIIRATAEGYQDYLNQLRWEQEMALKRRALARSGGGSGGMPQAYIDLLRAQMQGAYGQAPAAGNVGPFGFLKQTPIGQKATGFFGNLINRLGGR